MNRFLALVAIFVAGLLLSGCAGGGYQLQGRVIYGDYSAVMLVDSDDSRLTTGEGLAGTTIHVQQDPGQLNRRTLARGNAGGDGSFALPIDLIGAGTFNYDVGVFVRRSGFDPATGYFKLPPKSKRVLIVMTGGTDRTLGEEREDLYEQYEQFRDGP